jgi:hypothetical protein
VDICIDTLGSGAYRHQSNAEKPKEVAIVGIDPKREAGRRLKAYVQDRMGQVGIATLVELSERADVAYDTLHAWFRGRPPTPRAGGRVSLELGVTYSEMLAAYEGRPLASGRYVTDEELQALVEAAAEAAVARALRGHDGRGQ